MELAPKEKQVVGGWGGVGGEKNKDSSPGVREVAVRHPVVSSSHPIIFLKKARFLFL